jgi:hypothetical protein
MVIAPQFDHRDWPAVRGINDFDTAYPTLHSHRVPRRGDYHTFRNCQHSDRQRSDQADRCCTMGPFVTLPIIRAIHRHRSVHIASLTP